MTPAIRKLFLKLLKQEEHRLRASADAARYGFPFGVKAASALVVVRQAMAWIGAQG